MCRFASLCVLHTYTESAPVIARAHGLPFIHRFETAFSSRLLPSSRLQRKKYVLLTLNQLFLFLFCFCFYNGSILDDRYTTDDPPHDMYHSHILKAFDLTAFLCTSTVI